MEVIGSLNRTSAVDDLRDRIERERIVTVTLGELRAKIARVDRLGKHVLGTIRSTLDKNGVGYFPPSVFLNEQPRQHTYVRLFLRDSVEDEVIKAVLNPSDDGDMVLRKLSPYQRPETSVEQHELRELLLILESGVSLLQDVMEDGRPPNS